MLEESSDSSRHLKNWASNSHWGAGYPTWGAGLANHHQKDIYNYNYSSSYKTKLKRFQLAVLDSFSYHLTSKSGSNTCLVNEWIFGVDYNRIMNSAPDKGLMYENNLERSTMVSSC